MANSFYEKGAELVLSGGVDFTTDNIKVAVVSTGYTPNLSTDQYETAIASHILGSPQALADVVVTGGILDASDVTVPAVASGSTARYIVVFKDSGSAATSPLLMLLDTVSNFPFVTDGDDIRIRWSNGASRILKL